MSVNVYNKTTQKITPIAGGSGIPTYSSTDAEKILKVTSDGSGLEWKDNSLPIMKGTDAYSSSKSYAVNDVCVYNNTLYQCIKAHSNIVPTNTIYWRETSFSKLTSNLGGLMFSLQSGVPAWKEIGADTWSPFKSGADGVLPIIKNGILQDGFTLSGNLTQKTSNIQIYRPSSGTNGGTITCSKSIDLTKYSRVIIQGMNSTSDESEVRVVLGSNSYILTGAANTWKAIIVNLNTKTTISSISLQCYSYQGTTYIDELILI